LDKNDKVIEDFIWIGLIEKSENIDFYANPEEKEEP